MGKSYGKLKLNKNKFLQLLLICLVFWLKTNFIQAEIYLAARYMHAYESQRLLIMKEKLMVL